MAINFNEFFQNKKRLINYQSLSVSGRLDSNQRPLAPHTSALPGCATTRNHDTESFIFGAANLTQKTKGKKYNRGG